jgi:hypothetical protein
LFEHDKLPLAVHQAQVNDKLALLPQRMRASSKAVDDDF